MTLTECLNWGFNSDNKAYSKEEYERKMKDRQLELNRRRKMINEDALIENIAKQIISKAEVDKIIEKGEVLAKDILEGKKTRIFQFELSGKAEILFEAMNVNVRITITAQEA